MLDMISTYIACLQTGIDSSESMNLEEFLIWMTTKIRIETAIVECVRFISLVAIAIGIVTIAFVFYKKFRSSLKERA